MGLYWDRTPSGGVPARLASARPVDSTGSPVLALEKGHTPCPWEQSTCAQFLRPSTELLMHKGGGVDRGVWTAKTVKQPRQQPAHPQYANYWAPLTHKRHILPHSAQPQHTNYWAPRTRKRHQQEHRPQRPTERSDPTQHAKGRTGDCPGPRKGATTRRNVTQGGHPCDRPVRAELAGDQPTGHRHRPHRQALPFAAPSRGVCSTGGRPVPPTVDGYCTFVAISRDHSPVGGRIWRGLWVSRVQ